MDVNNINQVNNLGNISAQTTSSVNNTKAVAATDKDASNVAIKDLAQGDRNTLSLTLKTLNEGIATSKIAQNALQKQAEVLDVLSSKLDEKNINNLSEDQQNEIKKAIVVSLQNFNEIAQDTKFNNNNLLNQDEKYLNIATNNASFSIEMPNTTKISDNLITAFRGTNLNDPTSIDDLINQFKSSSTSISNTAKEFQNIEKNLQQVARDTIEEQMSALTTKAANNNINFGKEVLDFSKTNITSQLGFLVSSQANTAQAQSVRLLS
jgi:flagellin